ncbi:hypothetical protein EA462_16645 [Natrarchaeobius halalkaliphilus]|uniref:Uncharacterized protein n=1 Tax=Natrarchaeobius halalkaliphilus TaxID=1679091 RepID=A0A3N6LYF6_9EURY|nr:hypothetical protein [Natrarchaeobius halalkaliphilus]RQG86762.1 hypothetical protein EA462_16645 [Natrarchaeobius halalkaliphilus]
MYDTHFGTDWETIDSHEEVVRRAFALGVATRLGENYPDELDRLGAVIETSYDQSFVELAYHKGRTEAGATKRTSDADDEEVWDTLVEEKIVIEAPDEESTGAFDGEELYERTSLPGALQLVGIDTLPDDSTDRVSRPSFLDQMNSGSGPKSGEDRTVFGREIERVETDDTHRQDDDTSSGGVSGDDRTGGEGTGQNDSDGSQNDDDQRA